jgi:Flp pilus assembly protein TadD
MQTALLLAPDDPYIRGTYGSLLMEDQRWEEAVAQYRIVLRQTPRDTVILHNMGALLGLLGRLDEAERHFQLGLEIEPNSPRLLYAMGALRSPARPSSRGR